ncbi:hypothetical protein NL676_012873 [Syzygium grande]|nr:hypothetical protein NL676_012873 [Syzygium grande]
MNSHELANVSSSKSMRAKKLARGMARIRDFTKPIYNWKFIQDHNTDLSLTGQTGPRRKMDQQLGPLLEPAGHAGSNPFAIKRCRKRDGRDAKAKLNIKGRPIKVEKDQHNCCVSPRIN